MMAPAHTKITRGVVGRVFVYGKAHKLISGILLVGVLGGGWLTYTHITAASAPTLYVLGTVEQGTLVSSVTGSGQVSASDQVTINPKGSGQITAVYVHNGEHVVAGQAVATIDSTDAQKAVRDAQANLQSAQIALQKLQKPADTLSTVQAQSALSNAQSDLSRTYQSSYNDTTSTFLDLALITQDLKEITIGTGASHGSQWNIDYYKNGIDTYDQQDTAAVQDQRDAVYTAYTDALAAYNTAYSDYQATSQSSSTSTIKAITKETYSTAQAVGNALNGTNAFIQLYETKVKANGASPGATADSALSTISSDIAKMNSHIATLLSDTNTITADEQSALQSELSLEKLQSGADPLDLQSSQLSVQQRQNALSDAQDTLANYTIRAPFVGTLAGFNLHKGDTVGSGTAVATEISSGEIADLSLNEVDAAKIAIGNRATLTFDAINDLSIAGSVIDLNPLGTVSQGVVSYDVKIAFATQDARVKAGMTVNAAIINGTAHDALIVPSGAVHTSGSTSYVLVVDAPSAGSATSTSAVALATPPRQMSVVLGISNNTQTQITSGLTFGQTIVVRTTTGSAPSAATAATSRSTSGGAGGRAAVRF